MASDQFYLFTSLAAFNSAVQAQLRQVASPEDIVAIAAEYGFAITLQQLNFFFDTTQLRPLDLGGQRRRLARGFLLWQAPTGPVDSLINQPTWLASTNSGSQGSLMLFY
ncbi:MAG: Nif11 family protein [Cyanobacteriota bacterium]